MMFRSGIRRISVLIAVCVIFLALIPWGEHQLARGASSGPIYHLTLKASVNPITKDYLVSRIQQAQEDGASMVIIQLDTPGGLVSSTKDIVDTILNSETPIVVWVGPAGAWAASAGTFITMSAHVAAMAHGATIGAAHPVNIGGSSPGPGSPTPSPQDEGPEGDQGGREDGQGQNQDAQGEDQQEAVAQKITNFTAEWAREIAKVRGRNADWAEQAVRESVTTGAEEAREQNVIDLIADSQEELLNALNGYELENGRTITTENVPVKAFPMSWREQLLNYLADPNLVYILLTIGLLALTYEFLNPTIGIGFVVGGISLLLAFMGLQILPINLVGLGLVFFGILLMVLDVFTPTSGILTTGGVVSLLAGSLTLFDIAAPALQLSIWNVIITVGVVTMVFAFMVSKGLLIQKRVPVTGREGMIGAVGVAKGAINPQGWALVKGEYWSSVSADGEPIDAGEEVLVEGMEGGKLRVRRRP